MATLADVIHDTLDAERGFGAVVAARMGVPYHTLMKWGLNCNGEDKAHPIPAIMIPPFTFASRSRSAVEWIGAACSCAVIPLPSGNVGTRELAGQVCRTVVEFGHVASAAGDAIADGTVTRREAEQVEREGHEAIRAIVALIEQCKAAVKA